MAICDEATRTIRGLDREDASQVPIVAMTANAFEEDRQTALNAGMDEFITKPIDLKMVYRVLKMFVPLNYVKYD